jgi:hypothetical protein
MVFAVCQADALPAARLKQLLFFEGGGSEAFHGAGDLFAGLCDDAGIVEVGGGEDDGAGAGDCLFTFFCIVFDIERGGAFFHENAAADENGFCSELHHESCIGGGGDATGGEVWYGELARFGDHADEFIGSSMDFGGVIQLLLAENGELTHLAGDLAHVLDGVNDVSRAGLTLGANQGSALGNATERFAEIAGSADEGNGEGMFINMVGFVGGGENFAFVDKVDTEGLEHLGLGEVADTSLGHYGDGDGGFDFLDQLGIGHAGDSTLGANHGGHSLERHDGDCAGLFGNASLLDVHHVHDDSTFEHLSQADLETKTCSRRTTVVL